MKFGAVPLAQAEGAILAHAVPVASLSKGIVLGAGHLATLSSFGLNQIRVARLEDGDVDENSAASALAKAIVPDAKAQGVRITTAQTGRVNIMAVRAGVLCLDAGAITALNSVDPVLTVATLPDMTRVTAGVMLATLKVITYGVQGHTLARACDVVAQGDMRDRSPPFTIKGSQFSTATLIETHHAGARSQPKGRRLLDERLDRLGCSLVETLDAPHDQSSIAAAISKAKGQIVFLLTASATCDPQDTAPEAVRQAGGIVRRFGVPVDPGNLLFLGDVPTADGTMRPVIGLPGCARSPALNGADWVLERVMCDLPVGDEDINAMGVGGLLSDTPDRGRSRTEK